MVLCVVVLLVVFHGQVRLATQGAGQRQEAGAAAEGRDAGRLESRGVRGEGHRGSVAVREMLGLQLLLLSEVVVERKRREREREGGGGGIQVETRHDRRGWRRQIRSHTHTQQRMEETDQDTHTHSRDRQREEEREKKHAVSTFSPSKAFICLVTLYHIIFPKHNPQTHTVTPWPNSHPECVAVQAWIGK